MKPASEILSFMDLLDLDEEIIDVRAKNIMERKTFANEHLLNLINLLQYKQLINTREKSECTNNEEYDFVGKLILNTNEDNFDSVSKIIKLVLMLHPSSIINKSEHLIQQIISGVFLPSPRGTLTADNENEIDNFETTLLQLKICVSILDAVILSNAKLTLPFLDIPLEHIIFSKNEKLQIYFLTHAVPRFFEAITGYNILDRIWNCLRQFKENVGEIALKVLCCLSNYYLPVADTTGNIILESDVIIHSEFWDFILFGLLNKDVNNSHRKKSIYLAKRAIDCVLSSNKSINVKSASTFIWDTKDKINLKNRWDSYFILLDSLEEKQSNIVLPSLKIFNTINDIGDCWLNCAFHIALRHDNAQVRYQCLQYRLRIKITSELEAMSVLEAINDMNLFEHISEYEPIKKGLRNVLKETEALISVLKGAPLIKWSPAPLFHLTDILSGISFEGLFYNIKSSCLMDIIGNIVKIPCNNIVIRKAIQVNMSHFIANNCNHFSWKEYMNIYPHLKLNIANNNENPLVEFIKNKLVIPDTQQFLQLLPFSYMNIEFAITYFEGHDRSDFLTTIDDIVNNIQDINSRQYSNKNECLNDVIFVVHLYRKAIKYKCALFENLNDSASTTIQVLLQYVSSLLIGDVTFEIEKMTLLFEGLDYINLHLNISDLKDNFNQLYKSTMLLLNSDTTDLSKKTLSIFVLNTSLKAPVMLENFKQELLDVDTFVKIIKDVEFNENVKKENSGRLRNLFYEKSCEIVNFLIHNTEYVIKNETLDYIYNVLDSGGYGCLKWILKIINKIIPTILDDKDIKFNVAKFLSRIWNEIEELKSNIEYAICIQEFIIIITQDTLLTRPGYNNIVILYSNKILELASIKNTPLYYLVKRMNEINVSVYRQLYYVLCEILVYGVQPKKDHRISENMSVEILQNTRWGEDINKHEIIFNSHIKVLAVSVLSKIDDPDVLDTITFHIKRKVEDLFKNKQRYYSNSQHERSLLAAIQSLIFIFFKTRKVDLDNVLSWSMNFLGRIPHQTQVRLFFEWYIALIYYYKGNIINNKILMKFKKNNMPIQSQFVILYWLITHKLKLGSCREDEFEVVMNFFFSNIMGPIYSTRLYAQYLSSKLFETNVLSSTALECEKYVYSVEVVNKTLEETANVKDKSFKKLKNDYFLHIFDIIEDLTPFSVFWGVPQMYDTFNENIETDFLAHYLEDISECITGDSNDKIFKEWKDKHKYNWFKMRAIQSDERNQGTDQEEETQTIQKKYVPWKSMIDIDVYTHEKIKAKSDLIVVASLIDKLPNLGGMARTSEVFGVQTYVVDSMRHLQDKQFQGLSVSAERWVNVEEVRPGEPLKEYLMMKKAEGYTIVAAEQTSSSTQLQNFKFPKKTLLLLGHEKEGIPCDLLPLMDQCVEIPQQGVIRSLNVHVTAAIFVWEYARQNML